GICQTPATIGVARALATQALGAFRMAVFRSVCHRPAASLTMPLVSATNNAAPSGAKRTRRGPGAFDDSSGSVRYRPPQEPTARAPLALTATSETAERNDFVAALPDATSNTWSVSA